MKDEVFVCAFIKLILNDNKWEKIFDRTAYIHYVYREGS